MERNTRAGWPFRPPGTHLHDRRAPAVAVTVGMMPKGPTGRLPPHKRHVRHVWRARTHQCQPIRMYASPGMRAGTIPHSGQAAKAKGWACRERRDATQAGHNMGRTAPWKVTQGMIHNATKTCTEGQGMQARPRSLFPQSPFRSV